MKVVLDNVAHSTQGRAHVLSIDITKDWLTAEHYRIQMMPTQVFFGPDGRETSRHMGKLSEEEVLARLAAGS
jgi:thioredoxin 1